MFDRLEPGAGAGKLAGRRLPHLQLRGRVQAGEQGLAPPLQPALASQRKVYQIISSTSLTAGDFMYVRHELERK